MSRQNVKAIGTALWRLFFAIAFYPLLIGTFLWLYFTEAHWIFGAILIAIVLWFDRTWWLILSRIIRWRPHSSRGPKSNSK